VPSPPPTCWVEATRSGSPSVLGASASASSTVSSACCSVPTEAGTWNSLPPENSMPSVKPRTRKLAKAISTAIAATVNQIFRLATMLRSAWPL
jgi:hypothetical protein